MSTRPTSPGGPPLAPPVFLLGAARSGTTLLYKALCLHPEAAWISNWTRRFPARPSVTALNRLAGKRADTQIRIWFGGEGGNAYVYGVPRPASRRYFPQPVEGEPFFARCGVPGPGPGADDLRPDPEVATALRAAVSGLVRWSGGRVFVSKRIGHNWRIPLIAAAFPDARFVELVRDGRAVALSLSRVDWWADSELAWAPGTPRELAAAGRDPWELCAANWVAEVAAIAGGLRCVPPERRLRVTYEEFVAAPHRTLERVAAFAGLAARAAWDRRLARLSFPDHRDRWRADLDPRALATIEAVAAPALVAEGYQPGAAGCSPARNRRTSTLLQERLRIPHQDAREAYDPTCMPDPRRPPNAPTVEPSRSSI